MSSTAFTTPPRKIFISILRVSAGPTRPDLNGMIIFDTSQDTDGELRNSSTSPYNGWTMILGKNEGDEFSNVAIAYPEYPKDSEDYIDVSGWAFDEEAAEKLLMVHTAQVTNDNNFVPYGGATARVELQEAAAR
ncbi:uncharacterized protein N0V89_002689, partial [Didymosphaeria variabile]